MICKPFEAFLRDRYGDVAWSRICAAAGHAGLTFESMRRYPDAVLMLLVSSAAHDLSQPASALLEDVGTWLCTKPELRALRRLIRFSGPDFETLVRALDDLHPRARLAVPDLNLPRCTVRADGPNRYDIAVCWSHPGAAAVMVGMLRAMADEYGALALIDRGESIERDDGWAETLSVTLVDLDFAAPRDFRIGGDAA
jgi:hypothetical protein